MNRSCKLSGTNDVHVHPSKTKESLEFRLSDYNIIDYKNGDYNPSINLISNTGRRRF
jgi:hypothetical protein